METPYPLSQVAQQIQRSNTRDLIALVSRPDCISFAGGLPAADHLPLAPIATCLDAVLTRDGSRALQYGPPYQPLREWIAVYMQRRGVPCSVDQVFITNGAQQALEIVGRLLLDPGQPAVLESLTFTGIIQVTRAHAAQLRTAPLDLETGVDPIAFQAALSAAPGPARLSAVITGLSQPAGRQPDPGEAAAGGGGGGADRRAAGGRRPQFAAALCRPDSAADQGLHPRRQLLGRGSWPQHPAAQQLQQYPRPHCRRRAAAGVVPREMARA